MLKKFKHNLKLLILTSKINSKMAMICCQCDFPKLKNDITWNDVKSQEYRI